MERNKKWEITSGTLRVMAMVFMLCDHLWGTIVPGNEWLTCVGRLAFPIYAFLIVEGFHHTHNLKKYMLRLLLCAVLSEIPFNLAIGGRLFYPIHQNVIWSFLISLGLLCWNRKVQGSKLWKRVLVAMASILLGSLAGLLTMVDYYHAGILTVLAFYFLRGKKWWQYAGQLLCLWYINVEILGGLVYEFAVLGRTVSFQQQAFALLALIPIWLYRGNQGKYTPGMQKLYYSFYPAHLLILGLLRMM